MADDDRIAPPPPAMGDLETLASDFSADGPFLRRRGAASRTGETKICNTKLCFVATDRGYLLRLLHALSDHPCCQWVKLSREPKDGMYLGRAFLRDAVVVGHMWAQYKRDPRLMCTVQDDDFTLLFRGR